MASIPQFYSDYQYSPDEFSEITSVMSRENYGGTFSSGTTISSGATIFCDNNNINNNNNLPILFDNCGIDVFQSDITTSPVGISSPLDYAGFSISDMATPTLLDYKMGLSSGIAKIQNFGGGFQLPDVCEFGDDCCDQFIPNFNPLSVCPTAGENWGIQCNQMPAMDHTQMKVGKYTMEERKDRILRYLKKRNQRNFNKTIKYACRKTLADRRVRVRGRFARNNNELGEEESEMKKNDHDLLQEKDSYSSDEVQIKNDDDEWLQEAMASLMYVPYIAG